MTQKFEIKNRWTDEVLFSYELQDGQESGMIARHAMEAAIAEDANLCGANLCGADLRDANLRDANLWGANLWGANLRGANLRDANLCGANLCGADLRDANLWGANLCGANLCGANLWGANLWGANLRDANLWDADLRDANLRDANLWGAKNAPLIINGLRWTVIVSGLGDMRIGCQFHSIERWKGFSDELINRMDSYALEFWNAHKVMLLSICDNYKHEEEKEGVEA